MTRHRSPSLLVVAIVLAALFAASSVVGAFFAENADAMRVGAFLRFGASVPLAIFASTASSRLRFLGIEAAGTTITVVGGGLASAMMALSALAQWAAVQPDVGPDAARALRLLAFATGGPGVIVPVGLLIAGVAVTGGLSRKLPRWVMWSGLVIAVVAELSSLSLVVARASDLLPPTRFTGLAWLIAVGALLPSTRAQRN